MKIFMGLRNTGSLVEAYANGFRRLGHEVFTAVRSSHAIVGSDIDMDVEKMAMARMKGRRPSAEEMEEIRARLLELAWKKAEEADLCFFVWQSFVSDGSDLETLKKMGKKIVVRFCGSEVREPEVDVQAARFDEMAALPNYLPSNLPAFERRIAYLRNVERHADLIIGFSCMGMRPTYSFGALIYDAFTPRPRQPQREHPVILHAPSNPKTKGTGQIVRTLSVLREKGMNFGFKLVQNIPHAEMPKEYASADIFCNSLHYSGNSVYEAMNAGCAVADYGLAHARSLHANHALFTMRCLGLEGSAESLQRKWEEYNSVDELFDLPVVTIRPHNVEEKLAKMIQDVAMREDLARRGPEYVKKFLAPERSCQEILNYLADPESESSILKMFAYPFFSRHFVPGPDADRLRIYNKYNSLVRNCSWYRQVVRPGERAGLFF